MNLLKKLDSFATREPTWEKLFQGDTLFVEIKALHPADLEPTIALIEKCQQTLHPKLTSDLWSVVCAVLACARIAILDEHSYTELSGLLEGFSPVAEIPKELPAPERPPDKMTWVNLLRTSLDRLSWQSPLSASWAWDAITCFQKNQRKEIARQRLTLLLLESTDQGFTAELTLDLLEDGAGTLYPDPETMAFVGLDNTFLQSVGNAQAVVQRVNLWSSNHDIRWKIERSDGSPFYYLRGGSAGGAFALTLSKLFAEARQIQSV
jgi:hypothetical protein